MRLVLPVQVRGNALHPRVGARRDAVGNPRVVEEQVGGFLEVVEFLVLGFQGQERGIAGEGGEGLGGVGGGRDKAGLELGEARVEDVEFGVDCCLEGGEEGEDGGVVD